MQPLKHGTQEYFHGETSQNVVLLDDITSTGETLIDTAEKIQRTGGTVKYAIISAYRDRTAICNHQDQGIKLLSIASFDEIINHLKPFLSLSEINTIQHNPLICS